MATNVIDLQQYRKAKVGYQKLLERNPNTLLTFKDYCKIDIFLESVHKVKMMKRKKNHEK